MNTIYQSLCFEMNNHSKYCVTSNMLRKWLRTLLLTLSLCFTPHTATADEVLVAVASNFIKPMQAISKQFTQETGHEVKLAFGSSGKLMAQIKHGAPYDLFLSADKDKVTRLLANKLAIAGSEFIYAQGRLVLWSSKQGLVDGTSNILKSNHFQRIAVADAKLAPYGKAAEQVIDKLDIHEHIKPRMVKGENISQTYQFVHTGNAELGFIALSQITQHAEINKGSSWLVPDTYHQAIEQYAVTLNRAKENPAAKALSHFLQQESTLTLIGSFGYDLPSDKPETYANLR